MNIASLKSESILEYDPVATKVDITKMMNKLVKDVTVFESLRSFICEKKEGKWLKSKLWHAF